MTDKPDPALAVLTHSVAVARSRVAARTADMLAELGIAPDEFQLACRLLDDPKLRARLREISTRPDLAELRDRVERIEAEEASVREPGCASCGAVQAAWSERFGRVLCEPCVAEALARPSSPPTNVVVSALARARRAGTPATLTPEEWGATVAYFKDHCALCGGPWNVVMFATPIELGGGATANNCVPACTHCNIEKGKRTLAMMIPTKPTSPVKDYLRRWLSSR